MRSTGGLEGIGFCYVGSAGGSIAHAAVADLLAPKLLGQDSLRVEGLWQDMYSESLLQGRAGSVMRGISILDTALWDLNARAAKMPLHLFLGANVTDKVPAYASGGYYLAGKTPKMLEFFNRTFGYDYPLAEVRPDLVAVRRRCREHRPPP